MKKTISIVILTTITILSHIPAFAEPLIGKIGSSNGYKSHGGYQWYVSYMDLNPPRNFRQGEQIKIKLLGDAKLVYVRLLQKDAPYTSSEGIIDNIVHVPSGGVIILKLQEPYLNIKQVSVHSGHEAFQNLIDVSNGNADIVSIDVSMGN